MRYCFTVTAFNSVIITVRFYLFIFSLLVCWLLIISYKIGIAKKIESKIAIFQKIESKSTENSFMQT